MKPRIGIRPIIDGRQGGIREGLEEQTRKMAAMAKELIERNLFYTDGTPVEAVIFDGTIGGGAEAAKCAEYFSTQNVVGTLSVTPCWCYGSETIDLDPYTVKAVWGLNGTERPGAVYLAASMAVHAQRGLPAFAIYGKDVQDKDEERIPEDVKEKILRFARAAVAVGSMRNKAYVGLGSVAMGIGGSFLDGNLMQKYFGIRAEWVDMTEITRRITLGIYDEKEYVKELEWIKKNCKEGRDVNENPRSREDKDKQWEFIAKMTLVVKDIMLGNPKLNDIGRYEEARGRNAILGGFQGQRMWTDWLPNGDFTESILNTSFDWNGKKEPFVLATENDTLNGMSMLFTKLLNQTASVFADVRTYWSPEAVKRVTGWTPEGKAAGGFIHLINSGAAALDGTAMAKNANGEAVMKPWWQMTDKDISEGYRLVSGKPRIFPRRRLQLPFQDGSGDARHDGPYEYDRRSWTRPSDSGRLYRNRSRRRAEHIVGTYRSHLAEHLVRAETYRRGRVQGRVFGNGKLGRQSRRVHLRAYRRGHYNSRRDAAYSRQYAQRARG